MKSKAAKNPYLLPLYDRVIIKRDKSIEQKPDSLIYIPPTAQEKMNQGEVVAVGAGKPNDVGIIKPLQTKVGDKVLFGKFNGFEVQFSGEDLIVMREDEIFALIKE